MAPAELPITGDPSRLSARLLRVIDPHPRGPGRHYEDMAGLLAQLLENVVRRFSQPRTA